MFILCATSQNIPYKDANGTVQLCTLIPGRHNYPMLRPGVDKDGNATDPLLCDVLRALRKVQRISFDELLPGDREIMKSAPEGKDPVKHLAENVIAKTSPVGRHVNHKSDERKAKEAKAAEKGTKHARGGHQKPAATADAAPADTDSSGKPGGVSDKK